jgi:KUP system potassium uptake protein
MMTAFITTCMVALVALVVWRTPSVIVLCFFLLFIALDGVFLSAALNKVPEGGWFTLVLSFVIFSVFSLWRWGKERQWMSESKESTVLPAVVNMASPRRTTEDDDQDGQVQGEPPVSLSQLYGGGSISLMPGIGVFFDKVGGHGRHVPKVFTQFVKKFRSRPLVIVLFHMRPIAQPTVAADQRFVITRVGGGVVPSCYRVTLRHGYTDDVLTPDLGRVLVRELVLFLTRGEPEAAADDMPPRVQEEMAALELAAGAQMVYIMGKQVMRIRRRDKRHLGRRVGLGVFLWLRENSHTKLADLNIDPNSLVEIGYVNAI